MNNNDKLWTPDDIRQNASNWSLQSDAKLLQVMENISKTLQERGNRTTKNLHQMLLDLDQMKISLENTTNQLMSLQHKQFVENRVYDEDETLANTSNVPKEKPTKPKTTIIDALGNALECSMNMMEKYFDKVTFNLSDSEDDEDDEHRSVIFQPKDPYKNRPLPHLIGSKEWHEKWHIGLVQSDAEDNSDNDNDVDGMSESLSDSSASEVPGSLSESDAPVKIATKKSTGPADIFNYSSDENSPRFSIDVPTSNQPLNEPKLEPKLIDTSNSIFRPQKSPTIVPHVAANLIDSEPPELVDSPVKKVKETKKPINLFVDDDENDDMFARKRSAARAEEKPKVETLPKKEEAKPPKRAAINLFADDDDDDDFHTLLKTPPTSGQQTSVKSTKIKNLFEDDDDDDDDDDFFLFSSEAVNVTQPSTSFNRPTILPTQPKKDIFLCNLFDDEPPEDDFGIFKTNSTKKIEKSTKSIFGSSESIEKVVQPKKIEKEPSIDKVPGEERKNSITKMFDELDISGKTEVRSSPDRSVKRGESISVPAVEPKPVPKAKPTIGSKKPRITHEAVRLFDDTGPDDNELFSGIATRTEKPTAAAIQKKEIKQSGEFYNDFSETVNAIEEQTKNLRISSTPLLGDEPPSDGKLFLSSPKTEKKPDEDLGEPTAPIVLKNSEENNSEFSQKLNMFANPSTSEELEDISKKTATQPKKLNLANIDINVSALLPGAKRVMGKAETVDDPTVVSSPEPPPTSITKSISHDNVDDSGRLINLNRDRVKIPNRRPSTRRGRQQNYQKTLDRENTTSEVESSDVVDESRKRSKAIESEPPKVRSVKVESIEEVEIPKPTKEEANNSPKDDKLKNAIPSRTTPVQSDQFVDREQCPIQIEGFAGSDFIEEITKEVEREKKETESTTIEDTEPAIPETESVKSSAEEDPLDFPEMEIESPEKTKTSVSYDDFDDITAVKPISKATPVFFDEIPPEDTFDCETFDKAEDKSTSSLLSKNALSLFGDDDGEDNFEDQLFSTTLPETSIIRDEEIPANRDPFRESPPKLPSKQISLFGDDDASDDDDIFGGGNVKKKPEPIAKPKQPEKVSETLKQSAHVIEVPKKMKSTESRATKTEPKSNLFGDISDGDDDDNLFGPPAIPNNESAKKTSIMIKSAAISKSASLFGDDSSDDDLFGSKPKVQKPPHQ